MTKLTTLTVTQLVHISFELFGDLAIQAMANLSLFQIRIHLNVRLVIQHVQNVFKRELIQRCVQGASDKSTASTGYILLRKCLLLTGSLTRSNKPHISSLFVLWYQILLICITY